MNRKCKGYTLVELLVVMAIIGILSSLLIVGVAKAREKAKRTQCLSNLKQVVNGFEMFSNNNQERFPLATGQHDWGDPVKGWMEQLYDYIKDKAVYKCPSYPKNISLYNYFMSGRAAYVNAEPDGFAATFRELVKYPSLFVTGGDTNYIFPEPDCDKDDYTQNCLGWKEDGSTPPYRETLHGGGMNVTFMDTHIKWFDKHDDERMTFRYKTIEPW